MSLQRNYNEMALGFLQIHDDMELPCGVLRLQDKGGVGRHNGYISASLYLCLEVSIRLNYISALES